MNSELSTKFLLWALILFCCPDPGWTTQAEEMASLEVKMTNTMDRMTRMEAEMIAKEEMVEVRDERIAVLEAAVDTLEADKKTKDTKIAVLEEAMITKEVFADAIETRDTQMCELEEEMKSLTGRITETEETDVLLRGMVDQVRRLEAGDTISLRTGTIYNLQYITLCFENGSV